MKKSEIVILVLVAVALVYAACAYDASNDYTFHAHTAACAQDGCTFGK